MNKEWQKTEVKTSSMESRGETSTAVEGGTELFIAGRDYESTKRTDRLMEEVSDPRNLIKAMRKVIRNKGSAGIDGMKVEELPAYLQSNMKRMQEWLLTGSYIPKPVRRVMIPKDSGGERELGIPTVVDRTIQQAILQVISPIWEPTFSEHSHGFRLGHSQHQAIRESQQNIEEGYMEIVDIDLEKFFDRVNHDKLMSEVAKRIEDKRVLKLIRRYLNSGVMEDGLVKPREEGTPQGSPLSPLLSNIYLNLLDKELEGRGLRFVRYADDCNIYVRSPRAAERVLESISQFIIKKLKLKVNKKKSATGRYNKRSFLGFTFIGKKQVKRRIPKEKIQKFRKRVKTLTRRKTGRSIGKVIVELNRYIRGWNNYYGYCQTPSILEGLNGWIRRRLRSIIWKQWKTRKKRYKA